MDPLTMERVRGATGLVHDAIDAAVPAIARAHRGVTDMPFAILERVEAIAVPAVLVRVVHDLVTDGTYKTIRSTNRILATLTKRALDCAEMVFPVAKVDGSPPAPRVTDANTR